MAIAVKNISKRYQNNATVVLDDISLDIYDGEFLVLLGPSGCGKSTLLRIIAGLETQSSGDIFIDNTCVNAVSPKDRDVAMVFQNYALYPHMTVFDNMAFGLKMRKMAKADIQKRVDQAAASLELTTLLKRKPKELSGGQRQRVALGRAIVRQPKAFLMDEPLSNLDAKLRAHTRLELERLHQELKTTTVYVTHDQVEAMTLGERVVVLHDGKIQQIGAPDDVYQHPATVFVGQFMGQMALIPAKRDGQRLVFESEAPWTLPDAIAKKLSDSNATELLLGIRPEHFVLENHEQSHPIQPITLQAELVESLGKEKLIYGTFANTAITASLEPDAVTEGSLQLGIRLDRVSYFDAKTHANLMA